MKNLVTGLVLLGLTTLAFPQNSEDLSTVKLKGVTVTPNSHYLSSVSSNTLSKRVLDLENTAARYDITKSPLFDNRSKIYKISFKQSNGRILATFDANGKIIRAQERFKDIVCPESVRNYIGREFPGWIVRGNSYMVSYAHNQNVKKTYKVEIGKGNLQKQVKIGT